MLSLYLPLTGAFSLRRSAE